jgi:glycerol kinase
VDGGAAVNDLLMQIQADVIQKKVIRPEIIETTALGAAYLAGLAVGYWKSIDQLKEQWTEEKSFIPQKDPEEQEILKKNWNKALDRSKNWYNNKN